MAAPDLVLDDGVLEPGPLVEFQAFGGVARQGGVAVLPWRRDALSAEAAGVEVLGDGTRLAAAGFRQAAVHLQKSRAATWVDLGHAWRALAPGGRLLLGGGNDLGVTSAVRRLGRDLGQRGAVLANRSRARVVLFVRDSGDGPEPQPPQELRIPVEHTLEAEPGVFAAGRLDPGSALLISVLPEMAPARRVIDLGCGAGPLGLSALLQFPSARAWLFDADARAVRSAAKNAIALGLAERAEVGWWDASEPAPLADADLALLNPPFHTGKAVDLSVPRALFRALGASLAPGGIGLVVANRTLPYEQDLGAFGAVRRVCAERGFKLLELTRA